MKLRTKLTLFAVILILAAVSICGFLIINFSRQNTLNTIINTATKDFLQFDTNFSKIPYGEIGADKVRQSLISYRFRSISDSWEFALQTQDEIISNNTGIDAGVALERNTINIEENYPVLKYSFIENEGTPYIVMGGERNIDGELYLVALVRDISEPMGELNQLITLCIVVCIIICTVAALLMWFVVYKLFERHIEEIKAVSEERKTLLTALSHEMKTPVTAITGYSHALTSYKLTEEQKCEAITFIDSECKRLERLSGKLMQLISLQGEGLELVSVNSDCLFAELKNILAPIAEKQNINLVFESNGELFNGEKDLLICLLTNLFDNAKKAGATNITITAQNKRITLNDNGKGIAKHELKKITEPFYVLDKSRNAEGFGLGLALCERIAKLHNAKLVISSEENIGTVASIVFNSPSHNNVRQTNNRV